MIQSHICITTFSVISFDLQLKGHFLETGDTLSGYYVAGFKQTPPSHAPVVLDIREILNLMKNSFYECKDKLIVEDWLFSDKVSLGDTF